MYAYQAASAAQYTICWGEAKQEAADFDEAVMILDERIRRICKRMEAEDFIIALTDTENFRKTLFPAYKSNRNNKERPILLPKLREHIHNNYTAYQRPTLEADDVLGILATSKRLIKNPDKIIVSVDKDMRTIPGKFWDTNKGYLYKTTPEKAARFHMMQTLMGDITDGYPGCPNIGIVKATKLLDGLSSYKEMWPVVVGAFEAHGLTEADALVQAQVSRICQVQDYNMKTREVKLWKPI